MSENITTSSSPSPEMPDPKRLCAFCHQKEVSIELEAKVPGVPNSTSIWNVCDECAIAVLRQLTGVPVSKHHPHSEPEPAPGVAKRGLVCMACREGKHGDCSRPANRMPSFALAVCECEHPSHRMAPAAESEA